MGNDYDPDSFSVRVSPSLFRVIAGRASAPTPISPQNSREASLIAAVRREEGRRLATVARDVSEAAAADASVRAREAEDALLEATERLRTRYGEEGVGRTRAAECVEERARTMECYLGGRVGECAEIVQEFARCAREALR